MHIVCGMPGTWEFWGDLDKRYIESCKCVVIYTQDGWKKSTGVTDEIKWAENELNKPIIKWKEWQSLESIIKRINRKINV